MVDDDDDMKENNSTTSNEFVNDDFNALNKAINEKRNESTYQHMNEDKSIKGLTIEIDFQVDGNVENCVTCITHFTMDLIEKLIQSKAIDGAQALDGKSLLKLEFEDVEAQTIPPYIINKEQSMLAEIIVLVKTENTTYDSHENQKEFCDKHLIKVSTKRTVVEHASKIGYFTGTCVKLASKDYYVKDVNKRLKLTSEMINIKNMHVREENDQKYYLNV